MAFTETILNWYASNKRDLPWRGTRDPYLIWVSEIVLQQTRIDQGLPYYLRIVEKFPDIRSLALADEQELLRLWQGLGYYSRARNMHAAARQVMQNHGGVFPGSYEAILGLKGVGDYTAAAIGSIAFGLPEPVVDGNVLRFFSRCFGITDPIDTSQARKRIRDIASLLIDTEHPGDFNQAVMEFGARVCIPVNPACEHCIFLGECAAYRDRIVDRLPVRSPKATVVNRYIHYLVMTTGLADAMKICMKRRNSSDIWRNLYDFPEYDFSGKTNPAQDQPLPEVLDRIAHLQIQANATPGNLPTQDHEQERSGIFTTVPRFLGVTGPVIHLLTHRKLHAWFYRFHFEDEPLLSFPFIKFSDLDKYPVPKLVDRFLREIIIFAP